ncbi:MAG: hypothetical protein IJB19_05750 [Clostridia bacterium]|nr:hypothetical protein [Clostridia bacterium]
MKKIICLVLSFAMLFTMSTSAFAADAEKTDMDAALLERGYPQVYLDNISESAKESLYNKPDAVFAGAMICAYNEESGESFQYAISADGISTCGQIDEEDLTLTWGLSRYTTSGNVLVTYSYEWNNLPVNRYQDPIGVSWDDECFEMIDNSFYKVDKFTGYSNYGGFIGSTLETVIHDEANAYASASSSGVTWYADLVGHNTIYYTVSIYGHGEFLLKPKSTSFTTTLYGHYVHALTGLSLSLGIPDYGVGFEISGGASYDELGNQITYTY